MHFFHFRLRKGIFPCRTLACVELEIRKPLCIGSDNLARKCRRRDPLFLGRLNWWSGTRPTSLNNPTKLFGKRVSNCCTERPRVFLVARCAETTMFVCSNGYCCGFSRAVESLVIQVSWEKRHCPRQKSGRLDRLSTPSVLCHMM